MIGKFMVLILIAALLVPACAYAEPARISTLIIHYCRFDGDYDNWGVWSWSKAPKNLPGASFTVTSKDDFGAIIKVTYSGAVTDAGFILKRGDWQDRDNGEDRYAVLENGKGEIWLVQGDKKVYTSLPQITAGMHAWQDDSNKVVLKLDRPLATSSGNSGFWLRQRGAGHYGPVEVKRVKVLATDSLGQATTVELTAERDLEVDKIFFVEHDGYTAAQLFPRTVLNGRKYYYDGEPGCAYTAQASGFSLWAPTAKAVELRLYADAQTAEFNSVPMQRGAHGEWKVSVKSNLAGKYYMYAVHFNNPDISRDDDIVNVVVDPYAKATAPNTARCLIYDAVANNTAVPGWQNDRYVKLQRNTDAVIYEIHTRDMSISPTSGVSDDYKGKFPGLAENGTQSTGGVATGIDHVAELGVTHIHLLPVFDYGVGDERQKFNQYTWYDWGYDPALYNNVEGSYATSADGDCRQREFKQLVQRYHSRNIGVICDVVYNHTYQTGEGPFSVFDKIVPYYYYRVKNDGSYWNGSGCGNDVASERPMVRKFIVDSCEYWTREYHVDGFRFDLMGLQDKQTLMEVYREVKKINPNAIIYGEGWNISTGIPENERMTQTNVFKTGIAAFNDGIRDNLKGDVFKPADGGFVQGQPPYLGIERLKLQIKGQSTGRDAAGIPVATPNETVNYVSAHDNACIWDKLKLTNPGASPEKIKSMDKLSAAIVFTAQGVPFFAEGDDFGRSKKGDENSYNNNAPDINPIDWSLKYKNRDMYDYYKGLIKLRKNHPAFRMDNKSQIDNDLVFAAKAPDNVIAYTLNGSDAGDSWQTIIVIYNGTDKVQRIRKNGPWNIVVNDNSAGTDILAQAKNILTVQPFSALVAYKTVVGEDYTAMEEFVEMNDPYYGFGW